MKNKFFAMAFIALGLGTSVVSCTKDDVNPTSPKAVETTKVSFSVDAEKTNSATGKMVDKSIVPVYVDNLNIWAKSNINSTFTVHDNFTFGTSSATNPLDMGFSLSGVALGSNTFQAESFASESNARLSLGNVQLPNSGSNVLEVMKTHVPYIRTYSNQPTVTIVKGTNPTVALTMSTDYGRVLAKFVQETPNADDYICTVSATVPTGNYDAPDGGPSYTTLPETVITSATGFEWSNMAAVYMQKATFVIKIYGNNNGERGALLNTLNREVPIARATTQLATFTIHNTDVKTDIQANGIQLTFPTIGDNVINN